MFKRNAIAAAVLVAASSTAFAGFNESVIGQYEGTGVAQVEQGSVDGEGQFAQIVQQTPDTTTARIFQGNTTDTGAITTSDLSTQIVNGTPDVTALASAVAALHLYDPSATNNQGLVANYATIIQDTTSNSSASVYQVNSDDDDLSAIDENKDLANAGTMSFSAGAVSIADGVTGMALDYSVGDYANSGGSANNIALVYQGAVVTDRDGNPIGGAVADGADGEIALVVQSGINHIAQMYQSGDGQTAGIFQEGDHNDAFVAQYGDTNTALVAQLGSEGVSTVYQTGTGNTAVAFQYAPL